MPNARSEPARPSASRPTRAARPEPPTASLAPIAEGEFSYEHARHLLWRAGFGGTPSQIRALAEWGPRRAVDRLVNVDEIDGYPRVAADEFDADIMAPISEEERRAYRRALRNQDEDAVAMFRRRRQQRQRRDREQIRDMQRWWLGRMIESPRPLEEKMTLFWHGHFATSYRQVENSYHMFLQNQLLRRHAVGNFGELLLGVVRDPAMLEYLNNDTNRRGAPNENLARELMELFSLGEGAYSERDIKEGARALTGYTFGHNEFVFNRQAHDTGVKRILGKSGPFTGDDFALVILEQQACSVFIAAKLYEFFVADIPRSRRDPRRAVCERVVRGMAATLRRHRYDLKPMLRQLFLSRHFYDAANRAEKIKSPAELVVGAVRSLRTPVRDLGVVNDALGLMGQRLFFPPNVAGWAGGRSWINTSTLFVRQNILNFLLTGKTPTGFDPMAQVETYDPTPLLDDLKQADPAAARDPERAVRYLARFMLGREPSERVLQPLLRFTDEHGGRVSPPIVTGVLVLLAAAPEYQLC